MTSSIVRENFYRSLQILNHLVFIGAKHFILCPGSRSAPLAIAAGEFYKSGKLNLYNSIDERSAGFHALGIATASGEITVVITTSGTAVANLLPSAVEANKSCKTILYLTADRPFRLKECGANQTVNQEDFLISVCNPYLSTNLYGLHLSNDEEINNLLKKIAEKHFTSPGPIHLNVAFDKPLNISKEDKKDVIQIFHKDYLKKKLILSRFNSKESNLNIFLSGREKLNFSKTGIIIVGPYQGSSKDLLKFNNAIEEIQNISGWPIFADPVSGLSSKIRGLVENWELIMAKSKNLIKCDQLLRLGPMSSSNYLEKFLESFTGQQFLVKEGDSRNLDPVGKSMQFECGIDQFKNALISEGIISELNQKPLISLTTDLIEEGKRISNILKRQFLNSNKITETFLANQIPRIWPETYPIMLSASSPIRDWLTFSENKTLSRRCFSFRGASGIDGTLSLALGITRIYNPLLLVTGDLAFLHDINGLLIEKIHDLNIIILLIDNNGGNIFNKLYKDSLDIKEINKLFLMNKNVIWQKLADSHKIPFLNVKNNEKLKEAFEWGLSMQKSVIISIGIDVQNQMQERSSLMNKI